MGYDVLFDRLCGLIRVEWDGLLSGHSSCWAASTPIGPHVARSMGLGPANGSAPL